MPSRKPPETLVLFAQALEGWGLSCRVLPTFTGFRMVAGQTELLRYRAGSLSFLWFRVAGRGRGLRGGLLRALRTPRYGRFLLDMRQVYGVRL